MFLFFFLLGVLRIFKNGFDELGSFYFLGSLRSVVGYYLVFILFESFLGRLVVIVVFVC